VRSQVHLRIRLRSPRALAGPLPLGQLLEAPLEYSFSTSRIFPLPMAMAAGPPCRRPRLPASVAPCTPGRSPRGRPVDAFTVDCVPAPSAARPTRLPPPVPRRPTPADRVEFARARALHPHGRRRPRAAPPDGVPIHPLPGATPPLPPPPPPVAPRWRPVAIHPRAACFLPTGGLPGVLSYPRRLSGLLPLRWPPRSPILLPKLRLARLIADDLAAARQLGGGDMLLGTETLG
jgi:hypothetical protein